MQLRPLQLELGFIFVRIKLTVCFDQGGPGIRGARGDRGEPGPVVSSEAVRQLMLSD